MLGREGKVGQKVLRVPSLASLSRSALRGGEGAENLTETEKQTAFGLSKPNLPGALLPEFHLTTEAPGPSKTPGPGPCLGRNLPHVPTPIGLTASQCSREITWILNQKQQKLSAPPLFSSLLLNRFWT